MYIPACLRIAFALLAVLVHELSRRRHLAVPDGCVDQYDPHVLAALCRGAAKDHMNIRSLIKYAVNGKKYVVYGIYSTGT